jgi:hypothetical protein
MKHPKLLATMSTRAIRVLAFTVLLTAVACGCDEEDTLASCLDPGNDHICNTVNTGKPIKYLPASSACTDCSGGSGGTSCGDIQTAPAATTCIKNCRFQCIFL